uniref:Uncharacterized protein n=1 Tax=Oryza punctata TaxID=4537 RepID=A0A0E0MBG5_ORYPU
MGWSLAPDEGRGAKLRAGVPRSPQIQRKKGEGKRERRKKGKERGRGEAPQPPATTTGEDGEARWEAGKIGSPPGTCSKERMDRFSSPHPLLC